MQKARRHGIAPLRPLVSTRFQVLFTPLFGVLFIFPSRYWFTIGLSGVFSLTGWSRWIQSRFHVPRPTQDTTMYYITYQYGTITLCGSSFQMILIRFAYNGVVLQPQNCRNNFGLG